jgi:effector-binding domain-containing protein
LRLRLAVLVVLALCAPALGQTAAPMVAPSPAPLQQGDAFGEEVTLPGRSIIYLRGRGKWESAFDTLVDAFASLNQYVEAKGIKTSGTAMTVFTQTNDTGFEFLAALPIATEPSDPPKGDIAIGKAPDGRALKFTHRGSYDAMDTTYEAITNHLDQKNLDAKDTFVEEYAGGPLKKGDEALLVTIYVPLK